MSDRKVCGLLPLNSPIDFRTIQSSHRAIIHSIFPSSPLYCPSHNNSFFPSPFPSPLQPTPCNPFFFYSISDLLPPPTKPRTTQPRHNRRHPPSSPHRCPNAHMPTLFHRTRNCQRPRIQIVQAKSRPPRPTQLVQPRTKIRRLWNCRPHFTPRNDPSRCCRCRCRFISAWVSLICLPAFNFFFFFSSFFLENRILIFLKKISDIQSHGTDDVTGLSKVYQTAARQLKQLWDDGRQPDGAITPVENAESLAAAATEWYFSDRCGFHDITSWVYIYYTYIRTYEGLGMFPMNALFGGILRGEGFFCILLGRLTD